MIGRENFNSSGLLRLRYVAASISHDSTEFRYSYTYDTNNQLEKINYTVYKANVDYEEDSYVLFKHEDGELKTFKFSHGEYEKVKKKQPESKWIKEYYYVLERNKNGEGHSHFSTQNWPKHLSN